MTREVLYAFLSYDAGTLKEEIFTLYAKLIQLNYQFFAFRQYCIIAASLQTHFDNKHLIVPLKIIRHMSGKVTNPNSTYQKSSETGKTQFLMLTRIIMLNYPAFQTKW